MFPAHKRASAISSAVSSANATAMGSNFKLHGLAFPLTTRTRVKRKSRKSQAKDCYSIAAYSLGSELRLESLEMAMLNQGMYCTVSLPADLRDCVLMSAHEKYTLRGESRDIYFFRNGGIVFWNVSPPERHMMLELLEPHVIGAYSTVDVFNEREEFVYWFPLAQRVSRVHQDEVQLAARDTADVSSDDAELDRYALSDALAIGTRLSQLEVTFERLAARTEPWIDSMRRGQSLSRSAQRQVARRTGELYTLRHLINVSADNALTPDAYWERPNADRLFGQMREALNIASRTRIINAKLDLCCEFTELLTNSINNQTSHRLELIIIVLIFLEILFAVWDRVDSYREKTLDTTRNCELSLEHAPAVASDARNSEHSLEHAPAVASDARK